MKRKIVILFMICFLNISGFTIDKNNPMEFLNCYIYVIKRAIEEQKWDLDLIVEDSLCADYLSTHNLVIDKDTLKVIPYDYSRNKYKLKSFIFSDSIAIVQFQMDTVLVNEKNNRNKRLEKENDYIEFNVILDSSKETGVRINFGHPILSEDKKKGN